MKEKQFSRSAVIMAYHRAHHAMYDTPKIFDDFLAHHLVPEEARSIIEYHMAEALKLYDPELAATCPDQATAIAWMMRALAAPSFVLCRVRYAEDILQKAIELGVKQYVILGAGLDTFAFRKPEMLEQLQVFEVDHPATQAFKRHRIAELGWEQPAQLHFVPVDFEQDYIRHGTNP